MFLVGADYSDFYRSISEAYIENSDAKAVNQWIYDYMVVDIILTKYCSH